MDILKKDVFNYATELLSDNDFNNFITASLYQRVIIGTPGIGKTTLIQSLKGIKLVAAPTRALAIQLISGGCLGVMGKSGALEEYPIENIKQLNKGDDCTIVCTFDMAPIVAEELAKRFLKFELIIDEFHCIAGEASYRMPACSNLYKLIKTKKAILISGTVNPDTLDAMEQFGAKIKVLHLTRMNRQNMRVEWHRQGKAGEIDHIAYFIDKLPLNKSGIVFINCEKSIEAMMRKCKDMNISALAYTKTTQESKACKTFLESGDASPYRVVFCTSALVQGVSITSHIDYALIVDNFYGTAPDKIVQFIYRMRNNTPHVLHIRKNRETSVDISIDAITKKIAIENELAVTYRDLMKKKSHDRNGVDKEFLEIVDRHDILMNGACDNANLATILFEEFGCDYEEIDYDHPPKSKYKKDKLNWREAMEQFDEIYAPSDLNNPIFEENIVKFMHRAITKLRDICESKDEIKKVFDKGRGAVVRELLHVSKAFDKLRQAISMTNLKIGDEYTQSDISKEVCEAMKNMVSDIAKGLDDIAFDEVYEVFADFKFAQIKQILLLKRVQSDGVRFRYEGIQPPNFIALGDGGRYIENVMCIGDVLEPWNAFPVKLRDALQMIKEGDEKVDQYRQLLKEGKKDEANELKKTLHGFVFNSGREWAGGRRVWHSDIEYTGIIVLDVDIEKEVGARRTRELANIEKLFKLLQKDTRVLFMFRSVSGGLKIGIKTNYTATHDNDEDEKQAFEQVWHYVHDTYYAVVSKCKLKIDLACKDHLRVTYTSHDPDLFIRDQLKSHCLDVSDCMKLRPKPVKSAPMGTRSALFVDNRDYYSIIDGTIDKLSPFELNRTVRWGLLHGIKFLCNGDQQLLNKLQGKCRSDTSYWPVDVYNGLEWVSDDEAKRALFGVLKNANVKTGSVGVGRKRSLYAGMSNPVAAKLRVGRLKKKDEFKDMTTEQLLETPYFDDLRE